nr:TCF3 fusion partner homolog isoform X2 [Procambarus clarkii]
MMFSAEDLDNSPHEANMMPAFASAENGTEDKYYKKYNAILRRCSCIQKENEMLVNRVYQVKRIVRRLRKEREFLMEELDKRGDNYRTLPLTIAIEEDDKSFALPQTSSLPALGRPRSSSSTSSVKRQSQMKREKMERDPSAPKRPNNAFLQFCQEQRDSTTAQHLQQTGRPLDKKQLTKLLAARWSSLSEDDKKD